ncbi:MAG: HDOD domain-containing protein [Gammaproteobacteria bacterium]|nr:MAG: HDOD domain-containing protein [Gammaproteobacteria bacterium]
MDKPSPQQGPILSMNDKAEQFYQQLCKAVETDQLKLPSLPEVAINIRNAVEKETSSASQIAEILTQDAALAARLLQLANSPLYRQRSEITSLQMAVTRLGVRVVRDLVMTLAMKQIYKAGSDTLHRYFLELWANSVEVAALSRTLAGHVPGLDAEQGLLAGLIHNIGALPILQLAEKDTDLINNSPALQQIIDRIQCPVGHYMLTFWKLPQHLIQVVSEWHDFTRHHDGPADYTDVVQAAILQSRHRPGHLSSETRSLPALRKLGIDIDDLFDDNQEQIETTIKTLKTA